MTKIDDERLREIADDDYRNGDTLLLWKGQPVSKREVRTLALEALDRRTRDAKAAEMAKALERLLINIDTSISSGAVVASWRDARAALAAWRQE